MALPDQGYGDGAHCVNGMPNARQSASRSTDAYDVVARVIEGANTQFPDHAFALKGSPDGHRDAVRFSWTLAPHDGAPVACGTDIARLDGSGRISEVIGFLDGAT
jgi:hypothetical protein